MLSHTSHVMTLANSIIGVGILAMPFCFQKCGIFLAILLLIVSNWVTRVCCHYLIKSSLLTRRKSFEFMGFHAFGSSGKLLVELCVIGYLLGTCITYFVVVGDLGPQIVTKMFSLEHGHIHLRTVLMIAVTVVCILPLGMLKNVDSLSTVCTASIGFYVCLVIKIVLESKEHIWANNWQERTLFWEPSGVLQCLPIFSMALSCQMQLFEVFKGINNQSLEKLNNIVKNATWICTLVYIAVGFFGYVAFCAHPLSGNILVNLAPSFGSDVIKIGFVLSVAFSFPLVIFPCRASIYSLFYRKAHPDAAPALTGHMIPETRFKAITVFVVAFSLCIALMIPSVELIIGLVGSTIGVAICIMFPAACFRKIVKKESTERNLAQFILVSGFCLMILGTYANLSAIDEKRSGAHLEMQDSNEKVLAPTGITNILNEDLSEGFKKKLKFSDEQREKRPTPKHESVKSLDNIIKTPPKPMPPIEKNALSPAPLPIDEKHIEPLTGSNPKVVLGETKLKEDIKLTPPKLIATPTENKNLTKNHRMKPLETPTAFPALPARVYNETNKIQTPPQQNINRDAIKKDDEIAAEELKNNKEELKSKDDELKKTQNELQKTKELFARAVDELKEELAKKNEETQNLVVEKLGEVAEKVEEIERKVQEKKESKDIDSLKENKPVSQDTKPKQPPVAVVEADIPAEQAVVFPDQKEAIAGKQAELKKEEPPKRQISNVKFDQRLPLPLALLMNASQVKLNEHRTLERRDEGGQEKNEKNKEVHNQKPIENNNIDSLQRELQDFKQRTLNAKKAENEEKLPFPSREKRSSNIANPATQLKDEDDFLSIPKLEESIKKDFTAAIAVSAFDHQNIGQDLKTFKIET